MIDPPLVLPRINVSRRVPIILHKRQALLPIIYESGTKTRALTARPAKSALVSRNVSEISIIAVPHTRVRLGSCCTLGLVKGRPIRSRSLTLSPKTGKSEYAYSYIIGLIRPCLHPLPAGFCQLSTVTLRSNQLAILITFEAMPGGLVSA